MKATRRTGKKESSLELKYCERCGGLWLRPIGGGQIYCMICSRPMAELPPASTEVKRRVARKNDPEFEEEFEGYTISEIGLDEAGGVA